MTAAGDDWSRALDRLCPMHARLDRQGRIVHAGPTLRKIRPDQDWTGVAFLDRFELRRARGGATMADLMANPGTRLHLRLRAAPHTSLKGVLMPVEGGAVVDLSFGIEIVEAVRDFDFTSADFAPTDLTLEMLYLVEANAAAMAESRKLNLRLQGARIAAEEQAFTDTLTGLKNRRAMDHVLERLTLSREPFALMQIDLDYFKTVNDTLGHAAGDRVLQAVAHVLVSETRGDDTVARVGGDEFVLLLRRLVDAEKLDRTARRIIAGLEEPVFYDGTPCRISGSAGTTLSVYYDPPVPDRMLTDADQALYAAKQAGRGRHVLFGGTPVARADAARKDADQPPLRRQDDSAA